ncbi:MAG: TetR/AcrR family transcriptional regulator [Planctomyces sp.]|nr:TetR/AcrR family transcriptional regulator [Planctomyces sp.]
MAVAKSPSRMTTDERRQAILDAVRKVFAEKGFHGATTRELAEVSGVSEALLFKHFPTKEAIYNEVQQALWQEITSQDLERLMNLPASTESLVALVRYLVARILQCKTVVPPTGPTYMEQLMLRSLLEDGSFARGMLKRFEQTWVTKFVECVSAAREEGTLVEMAVPDGFRGWLVHDMAVMTMIQMLPDPPAAGHGLDRDQLIRHSVSFALRGIGLRDDVVRALNPPGAALGFPTSPEEARP